MRLITDFNVGTGRGFIMGIEGGRERNQCCR